MDVFGLDAAQLAAAGATWTAREILQQPTAWSEIQSLLSEQVELHEFLQPLVRSRGLQLILTGAGTSAHVGACLAPALRRGAACTVAAVPTTDLVASPESYLTSAATTLLVSFARSGNSPESVAAVELAEQYLADCCHLLVTCDADGALYRRFSAAPNARALLLPEKVNDRSFAMTSSFSGMLLAAALALGAWPARISVQHAAALAARVLGKCAALLHELVAARYERIVYLGSREFHALARESALKMLEMTDGRVVAIADSTLGFRHGPKTILNERALVVVFISGDAYTAQYDWDMVRELRRDAVAGRIIALSGESPGGAHPDDVSLQRAAEGPLHDLELCLPYIVFAQCLALLRAISLGVPPDSPNAAGTVSRVVRGVTIHPWSRSM